MWSRLNSELLDVRRSKMADRSSMAFSSSGLVNRSDRDAKLLRPSMDFFNFFSRPSGMKLGFWWSSASASGFRLLDKRYWIL